MAIRLMLALGAVLAVTASAERGVSCPCGACDLVCQKGFQMECVDGQGKCVKIKDCASSCFKKLCPEGTGPQCLESGECRCLPLVEEPECCCQKPFPCAPDKFCIQTVICETDCSKCPVQECGPCALLCTADKRCECVDGENKCVPIEIPQPCCTPQPQCPPGFTCPLAIGCVAPTEACPPCPVEPLPKPTKAPTSPVKAAAASASASSSGGGGSGGFTVVKDSSGTRSVSTRGP